MATTEIAKVNEKPKAEMTPFQKQFTGMRDFLVRQSPQMKLALQKYLTEEEMIRFALNAMYRNPKLLQCTPESVGLALMKAGQMGIRPDGYHGHLIPYWNKNIKQNECQFQVDYKGLVALAYRNTRVKSFKAGAVREGDFFEYEEGSDSYLRFRKCLGKRGELIAAWAYAKLGEEGAESFVVLGPDEVAKIRSKSQSANQSDSIWNLWPDAMWAKTAAKQLSKFIPLGPDFIQAVQVDDDIESGRKTIDIRDFQNLTSVPTPEGFEEEPESNTPKGIDQKVSAETLTTHSQQVTDPANPIPTAKSRPAGKKPVQQDQEIPLQEIGDLPEVEQKPKHTGPSRGQELLSKIPQCTSIGQLEYCMDETKNYRQGGSITQAEFNAIDIAIQARRAELCNPSPEDQGLFGKQPRSGNYS